jgi:alkanesulfonate monooxygenase SsuD/methylene tetrahydromethanopterin reductase-like flavin-dependent oxidoreductase (luciferase family)
MTQDRLLIGLMVDATEPQKITEQVQAAERYGLNLVLFDDGPGEPAAPTGRYRLDPIESASFASATTRSIGIVATASATHAEPFHLSNRFSSLDWGSSGRAGWLVTLDATPERARAYSAAVPDAATAGREANAVLDAARRLWDSWEDGALIADTASGRFLDHRKLHYVDAGGEFFDIRGPALMPRPVQGQVVVLARAGDAVAGPDVTLVEGATAAEFVPAAARARAAGATRIFAEVATGPAVDLLALLRELRGRLDGVVLYPDRTDAILDDLGRTLLPALRAEGALVPPRPGETLRAQLGLPRPAGRYPVAENLVAKGIRS